MLPVSGGKGTSAVSGGRAVVRVADMFNWRHKLAVMVVCGMLFLAGCNKKKTPVTVPPVPVPLPQPADTTVPPPAPSPLPRTEPANSPAEIPTRPIPPQPGESPLPASTAKPASEPPRQPQQPSPETGPYVPQGPIPPPEKPPATPAPGASRYQLGQLLTPEQQREYQQKIDESLKRARASLLAARPRLTASYRETFRRVETFIRQAEQLRRSDPVQAFSFAERADLLAQDLLRSLP